MGIFMGLLLGKHIGISLASYLAVKLKVGQMPAHSTWKTLIAVACLGGIGFTMSIFVDTLSFTNQPLPVTDMLQDMGKVAVLMGSIFSAVLGSVLILLFSRPKK
jgi:NhaA family Na+:H+ antiporter